MFITQLVRLRETKLGHLSLMLAITESGNCSALSQACLLGLNVWGFTFTNPRIVILVVCAPKNFKYFLKLFGPIVGLRHRALFPKILSISGFWKASARLRISLPLLNCRTRIISSLGRFFRDGELFILMHSGSWHKHSLVEAGILGRIGATRWQGGSYSAAFSFLHLSFGRRASIFVVSGSST